MAVAAAIAAQCQAHMLSAKYKLNGHTAGETSSLLIWKSSVGLQRCRCGFCSSLGPHAPAAPAMAAAHAMARSPCPVSCCPCSVTRCGANNLKYILRGNSAALGLQSPGELRTLSSADDVPGFMEPRTADVTLQVAVASQQPALPSVSPSPHHSSCWLDGFFFNAGDSLPSL